MTIRVVRARATISAMASRGSAAAMRGA